MWEKRKNISILKEKHMPFIKVWLHCVWATKNSDPLLTKEIRPLLFEHIRLNAKTKQIFVERINGHLDLVHCLVSLGSSQSIDKIAQLLKGEAAFLFNNKSGIKAPKLQWQEDYFCVSISESGVDNVPAYIDNKEVHHQKKTFTQEYEEFMTKYKFQLMQ